MHYFDFSGVENWEVLSVENFHFFDEEETSFEAVCVKIGTMSSFKTSIHGTVIEKSPIIRWLSRVEFESLKKNTGVIIF